MTVAEGKEAPTIDSRLKDAYVAARRSLGIHESSTRAGLEAVANDALYKYGTGVEAAVQQSAIFERVGVFRESIVYANTEQRSFPLDITPPNRICYDPLAVFFVVNTAARGEDRYLLRWDRRAKSLSFKGYDMTNPRMLARAVVTSPEDSRAGRLRAGMQRIHRFVGGSIIAAAGALLVIDGWRGFGGETRSILASLYDVPMIPPQISLIAGTTLVCLGFCAGPPFRGPPLELLRGGAALEKLEKILQSNSEAPDPTKF